VLPRVIAFVEDWRPELERRVLARVGDVPADIVIVHGDGAWSFARERHPQFAGEAAALRAQYGMSGDGLLVIDHRGVTRFAHQGPIDALAEALSAAVEALDERRHHSILERIQFTAREWTSKCLVVGFALTLQQVPRPRRFARGTGPVCTPRASNGAQTQQTSAIGEWPSALCPRRAT
jgi:hypothetical protein